MSDAHQRAFTQGSDCILTKLRTVSKISYNGKTIDCITLWDTGATCSAISKDVVDKLDLVSLGKQKIKTPSGPKIVNTYMVNITLPNDLEMNDWYVIDSEIGDQKLDLLVGMDVISKGDFSVSNYNGKTTFTFRTHSQNKTDYVQQLAAQNVLARKGSMPHKGKKRK